MLQSLLVLDPFKLLALPVPLFLLSVTLRRMGQQIVRYMKGTSRTGAREGQALGLHTIEGKDPMPFVACVRLASILACSQDPENVAAHSFLLLDWNTVSCAENAVNSHMDLFGIFDDALLVYLGPSKGDQEGTKHIDHPWHLYTVPENPAICPVLAFAKYLMCHPQILNGECKIFDGSSQYERMNAGLKEIVHSDEHLKNLQSWVFSQSILGLIQFVKVQSPM